MSTASQPITSHFIDTPQKVTTLIDDLADLPDSPPSLYLDVEGVDLSRQGTISIIQLFAVPKNCVYLIDIYTLGAQTFHATGTDGKTTLRSILESESIPKVFFDVRNDSGALHASFDIKLSRVHDIQLMELAARHDSKKHVSGLAKCIERHSGMKPSQSMAWMSVKEKGIKLFDPNRGGGYEVFNTRPLPTDILDYCVQDVQFMPLLWNAYSPKLNQYWTAMVSQATKDRIAESQKPEFNGKGKHMALGPWGP
ncbi:MAG: hypothetical protein Q9218_007386 [Villophora microphyllina]